jgi:hypothetical protein
MQAIISRVQVVETGYWMYSIFVAKPPANLMLFLEETTTGDDIMPLTCKKGLVRHERREVLCEAAIVSNELVAAALNWIDKFKKLGKAYKVKKRRRMRKMSNAYWKAFSAASRNLHSHLPEFQLLLQPYRTA